MCKINASELDKCIILRERPLDIHLVSSVKIIGTAVDAVKWMKLWGSIEVDADNEKVVDWFEVQMQVHYLKLKVLKRDPRTGKYFETLWEESFLVSPCSHEVKEAWNKIKGVFPATKRDIRTAMELLNYPNMTRFDDKLSSAIANRGRRLRIVHGYGFFKATVNEIKYSYPVATEEIAATKE